MNKNILRFLPLVFTLVLTVCNPAVAGGQTATPPDNEIWYTSSDDQQIELSDYSVFGATYLSNTYKDGKGIVTFDGPVTAIGSKAFYGCKKLTSIRIPESATSIEELAFAGCSGLTGMEIPELVKSIKLAAFYGCTALKSIEIPESVQSIGESAFEGCTGLTSVIIPESVTSIGSAAFRWCSSPNVIVEWTDADKIPALSDDAFPYKDCNLYVPERTTDIYSGKDYWKTFKSINVHIPFNLIWYTSSDGQAIEPTDKTVFGAAYLSSTYDKGKGIITFDGAINTIGKEAFKGCSNLTGIRIPESVTSIGNSAFHQCTNLKDIGLPKSLESIGEGAFYECSSLSSIALPELVTSIEKSAFQQCSGLASVKLHESVTSIGECAFYECSSLAVITLPESVKFINNQAFYGTGLKSVFVGWTDADKIPSLREIQFPYENCDLYIPYGTEKIYREKPLWTTFKNLIEPNLHIVNESDIVENRYLKNGEDLVLDDNIKQIVTKGTVENIHLTYTRNFAKADKWQGWYVPFDVPMEDMVAAGFDVAEIYGILLDNSGNTVLAFLKMEAGTVKANTPYAVRPKEGGNVTVTTATTLHPTVAAQFAINSAKDTYTVGGIYEKTTTPGNWYAMNKDGRFQKMGKDVSLRPLRIRMTITPRGDNPYAQPDITKSGMNMMIISRGQLYERSL